MEPQLLIIEISVVFLFVRLLENILFHTTLRYILQISVNKDDLDIVFAEIKKSPMWGFYARSLPRKYHQQPSEYFIEAKKYHMGCQVSYPVMIILTVFIFIFQIMLAFGSVSQGMYFVCVMSVTFLILAAYFTIYTSNYFKNIYNKFV